MATIQIFRGRVDLLAGQASNTTTPAWYLQTVEVRNGQLNPVRIKGTFYASGTFGGGTVKLQAYDGAAWYDITGVSLTAAGYKDVDIDAFAIRAVLSGAVGSVLDACFLSALDFALSTAG